MSKKKGFLKRARIAARYAFGYDAAKNTRNRKNRGNSPIRSEDIELSQYERDRVVSACLDFKRNNPVVASISRLRKMDVVGKGIVPQPMTGDDALDALIESKWATFCEAPEITGHHVARIKVRGTGHGALRWRLLGGWRAGRRIFAAMIDGAP